VPDAVLEASALEHTYGSGDAMVHAVRGIELTVEAGERLLLMGPSGSGKTTLLSMLGGLLSPSRGNVRLAGEDIYAQDERSRARLRLGRMGFVFQSFNLLSALTARENVEVPARLAGQGAREARSRAEELLGRLGLQPRADHLPRDLSGGEKQRVAIARALANDPDVLLADEPTANLDSNAGHEVAEILSELASKAGKAIVIVSHDQRLVSVASRTLRLEDGAILDRDLS